MRYGWATQNPILPVRTSSKQLRDPDLLTADEFKDLLRELNHRERILVLLAGSTTLRRGEMRRNQNGCFAQTRAGAGDGPRRVEEMESDVALSGGEGFSVSFNSEKRESASSAGHDPEEPHSTSLGAIGRRQEDWLALIPSW